LPFPWYPAALAHSANAQSTPTIFETTLEEPNQLTPEISTSNFNRSSANDSEPVLDVRSPLEYAIAHIPGRSTFRSSEVAKIMELYPHGDTKMILTCNGPFLGKEQTTSEQLVANGYVNVRRISLECRSGAHSVTRSRPISQDLATSCAAITTAVFVDARTPEEFKSKTVHCA